MERRDRDEAEIGAKLLLGSLIAAACVASVAILVDSLALIVMPGRAADLASAGRACNACGIIEEVREFHSAASRHEVSTVAGGGVEGIAVILGTLGGKLRLDPVKIYEVAVRMQDGSVRNFHSATPPPWKAGDRVKVVMGAIRPVS
jgi:hypothetical protein